MCPACYATVALAVSGATSTGGLTALAVKTLFAKKRAKKIDAVVLTKGDNNGATQNRVAR